jgi:hypothetical protein
MFSMMIEEHSGTLTTAENQAQCWNTPKPKYGALNFNHNEARVDSKSSEPTGDLRTGKISWALLDTHRTSGSKSKSRKHLGTTRGQLSAPRPRNFSAWTREFIARARNFLVLARKLARKFCATCFQQPEPTKKKPKLDQTNSDWAQSLWRCS